MAQQAGINVAGHNISNINNEDFSRQRVSLTTQHPYKTMFGSGVDLDAVERSADAFINRRLISEQSQAGALDVRQRALMRLENLFNETEGLGVREALNEFWGSWGKLANQPESDIFRTAVVNSSKTLSERFNHMHNELQSMREEMNGRLAERVEQINQLAAQLAEQNKLIQQVDKNTGEANDVLDQREATLKEMSKLIKLRWHIDGNTGAVTASVGNGWPLVTGRFANRLEASFRNDIQGNFTLRGIDPQGVSQNITAHIGSGEVAELVNVRDSILTRFQDKIDRLAGEMAFQVNKLHAAGTGLGEGHQELTSSFALRAEARELPMPFLKNGSFTLKLVDENREVSKTYDVPVFAGQDSLATIVERINRTIAGVAEGEPMPTDADGNPIPQLLNATENNDGSVTLRSRMGQRFVLGQDSSDFSVVMGFNNFFENIEGAKDLRVTQRLLDRPADISTGYDLLPGDNRVALGVHELQYSPTMDGDSITFDEFYNSVITEVGMMVNRNQSELKSQQLVVEQFERMRSEISSVNMDEEVADMVQYQRGFDAAAKFMTTVDEMTRTIIQM